MNLFSITNGIMLGGRLGSPLALHYSGILPKARLLLDEVVDGDVEAAEEEEVDTVSVDGWN